MSDKTQQQVEALYRLKMAENLSAIYQYQLNGSSLLKELWWDYLVSWGIQPVTNNNRLHIYFDVEIAAWQKKKVRVNLWPTTQKMSVVMDTESPASTYDGPEEILRRLDILLGEANGLSRSEKQQSAENI